MREPINSSQEEVHTLRNSTAVWKVLTDEEPIDELIDVVPPKPHKKTKRRLVGVEYEEVLASYWRNRPEESHDREDFVKATMDWAVYAFLHEDGDHGRARNHEIVDTPDSLIDRLFISSDRMMNDIKCKVEIRPVCWWDIQEHYHNVARKDIRRLAEDLHEPLLREAVERLKATGFISWHSGVWTLSSTKSLVYIQRLKQRGRIFLAPEPSKRCGLYVA